jgi:hypothetical protein
MRPFADAAGIGIEDEGRLEEQSRHSIDRMMHDPVTHGRLMNDAMLWIKNVEALIRAVTIRAHDKLFMKRK